MMMGMMMMMRMMMMMMMMIWWSDDDNASTIVLQVATVMSNMWCGYPMIICSACAGPKNQEARGKGNLVACFSQNDTTLIYYTSLVTIVIFPKVRMARKIWPPRMHRSTVTPQREVRLRSFHADFSKYLPGDLDDLFEAAEVRVLRIALFVGWWLVESEGKEIGTSNVFLRSFVSWVFNI